ncbi:XRE family transcriptional regulator [Staphylococcus haemolyticus]|uniref:helix-turn-helix domain-containing protein n=2 Tax=Staphylococcus haemolyticus TaxID=1283 RepID=UPI000D1F602B|nr:helix-turn-helix transcriptional regulator [Staphylococcus haemolyticus]PTK50144.1 XRE family transcriptional regulator [Staphylococcus haemolyticus]PTL02514.1 XRE family transcriptional regulator [Staphylococcus haemolyticus]
MVKDLDKKIGNFLKEKRKEKRITAQKLGKNIGYSQSHISGIENGQKSLPNNKFVQSYLMFIKSNYEEYNQYIDELSDITNGEMQLNKITNITKQKFIEHLDKTTLPFEFNYLNVNEEIETDFYNLRINDLLFHLFDINNEKFYRHIMLTDEDKNNIKMLIDNYFRQKSGIQKNIVEKLNDNKNDVGEILKESQKIENEINILQGE